MQRVFHIVETHALRPSGAKTTSRFSRSVRRYGVLTPILLAEVPDADGVLGLHTIDGNRRVRAAQAERLPRVPAVVLKAASEKDRARLTLVCNHLRSNNFQAESRAILALAQDDADAEQVGGGLGLGAVKMRQLYEKIVRMPEPVRRAMDEHRIPVMGAQWVSAWPEPLRDEACELVERRRYVPLKALKELRDRYEQAHPEAFGQRREADPEPGIAPDAVTEVWIDTPSVASEPVAVNGRDAEPGGGAMAYPVAVNGSHHVPADRSSRVALTGPDVAMVAVAGLAKREPCAPINDTTSAGDESVAGEQPPAAVAGGHAPDIARPVAVAASAAEPGSPPPSSDAEASQAQRAAELRALVARIEASLEALARDIRDQGLDRAVWIDRTVRAWDRLDRP